MSPKHRPLSVQPRHDDDVECPMCYKSISVLRIRQHIDFAHTTMSEQKREEGGRRHRRKERRAKAWFER